VRAEVHDATLVVWRPVRANMERHYPDVEAFVAKVDALVQGSAVAPPASSSG